MRKKRFSFSTTQLILLSFLFAVMVGSVLLSLPLSSKTGKSVSYIDALFTSTTSVCVTGLVTVPTFSTWSFFGQLVILALIQIGGLGIITVMSMLMILLHRKIGIGNRTHEKSNYITIHSSPCTCIMQEGRHNLLQQYHNGKHRR